MSRRTCHDQQAAGRPPSADREGRYDRRALGTGPLAGVAIQRLVDTVVTGIPSGVADGAAGLIDEIAQHRPPLGGPAV